MARVSSKKLSGELATEGGFTVHDRTGERPTSGFAVADFGAEEIFPAPGAGEAEVEAYRSKNATPLAGPRKFLGGWRDTDDVRGHADYLDVSNVVPTRREAFDIGQQTAQRAVMDLSNFQEHSVPFKPGLPGPNRTGQDPKAFRQDEAQNREYGRRMIENQLHGRANPAEAAARGAAIADDLIAREGLHQRVRGMNPKAQVKRGK